MVSLGEWFRPPSTQVSPVVVAAPFEFRRFMSTTMPGAWPRTSASPSLEELSSLASLLSMIPMMPRVGASESRTLVAR